MAAAGDTPRGAVPPRIPTYFVSTPPGRRRTQGGSWELVPFATHHAGRLGSTTTACGKPALTWTNFYTMPFDATAEISCPACAAATGH